MALLNTPLCDFGWQAPDFTLKTPEGAAHSLSDYLGQKGVVIAFLCNHCPYVIAVAKRLGDDARTLAAAGIPVIGIMSNDYHAYHADSPANMTRFAAESGWDFPYLVDETQEVARAYDAVCTPDFFGFDDAGGLQYRGRLDDARMGDATARVPELLDAMMGVADTGTGPSAQTPSMGCSIKWR